MIEGRRRAPAVPSTSSTVRAIWFAFGWVAVAVGAIGVVFPVIPTTGPFILAAWCFARSSPRFEAWVLGLPTIGPMIQDHRAGLGMPRRAKVLAISMIVLFCALSAWRLSTRPLLLVAVVALGLIGVAYISWRVPTRERVRGG